MHKIITSSQAKEHPQVHDNPPTFLQGYLQILQENNAKLSQWLETQNIVSTTVSGRNNNCLINSLLQHAIQPVDQDIDNQKDAEPDYEIGDQNPKKHRTFHLPPNLLNNAALNKLIKQEYKEENYPEYVLLGIEEADKIKQEQLFLQILHQALPKQCYVFAVAALHKVYPDPFSMPTYIISFYPNYIDPAIEYFQKLDILINSCDKMKKFSKQWENLRGEIQDFLSIIRNPIKDISVSSIQPSFNTLNNPLELSSEHSQGFDTDSSLIQPPTSSVFSTEFYDDFPQEETTQALLAGTSSNPNSPLYWQDKLKKPNLTEKQMEEYITNLNNTSIAEDLSTEELFQFIDNLTSFK